ncbi:hypothetical protein DFP72DRAFT_1083593 [Ephemerocybe angulata]|uniref:Uncharacterized protein n=1 Tax=Ephemerocybe angulata TaxID=980116 RepID=A0A8H6H9A2_9AGAR|nr:hypothetical protein DFP72DRAFT_1083593 [Tulosesus angulatus]
MSSDIPEFGLPGNSSDDGLGDVYSSLALYAKTCRTCRTEKVWGRYVNCEGCRDKAKAKKDMAKIRKAMRQQQLEQPIPSIANAPMASSSATGSSPVSVKAEKREPVPLKDLTGEEREVAVRMMKAYVGKLMRKQAREPYPQAAPDPKDGTEYQTAGELYSALRVQVLSGKKGFDWKGFHVIVASDDVDHKQRLEAVARDLHKTAKLPFEYVVHNFSRCRQSAVPLYAAPACTVICPVTSNDQYGFKLMLFQHRPENGRKLDRKVFVEVPSATGHPNPVKKQRNREETMRNGLYLCTCKGYGKPAPKKPKQVAVPPPSLKKTGSLMNWARAVRKVKEEADMVVQDSEDEEVAEQVRVECGGRVKIVVREDADSHPSGIVGQRITVEIEH